MGAVLVAFMGLTHAQDLDRSSIKGRISEVLDSPAFSAAVSDLQRQNQAVVNSVNDDAVADAKKSLPRWNELGGTLKYGTHNVRSADGEKVIGMIRSAVTAHGKEREDVLHALDGMSAAGMPEAVNFMGFLSEYGLFGTRKDVAKAMRFYQGAAGRNYQPAVFNLGIAAAYGKLGAPARADAVGLMDQAAGIAEDTSARVCGFGAFLHYRHNDQGKALKAARGCLSPLAGLPLALWHRPMELPKQIEVLRHSVATGVDDGYGLLEQVTRPSAIHDAQLNFCKYYLVNRYRNTGHRDQLKNDALECVSRFAAKSGHPLDAASQDSALRGLVGAVTMEIESLQAMRQSNHFHYAWSVPYLPFTQQDVDLFEPIMKEVSR